jgi:hypothetical protein
MQTCLRGGTDLARAEGLAAAIMLTALAVLGMALLALTT